MTRREVKSTYKGDSSVERRDLIANALLLVVGLVIVGGVLHLIGF